MVGLTDGATEGKELTEGEEVTGALLGLDVALVVLVVGPEVGV